MNELTNLPPKRLGTSRNRYIYFGNKRVVVDISLIIYICGRCADSLEFGMFRVILFLNARSMNAPRRPDKQLKLNETVIEDHTIACKSSKWTRKRICLPFIQFASIPVTSVSNLLCALSFYAVYAMCK